MTDDQRRHVKPQLQSTEYILQMLEQGTLHAGEHLPPTARSTARVCDLRLAISHIKRLEADLADGSFYKESDIDDMQAEIERLRTENRTLSEHLLPLTHRLCVVCGEWFPASEYDLDALPCAERYADQEALVPCTLDMTLEAAVKYWGRKAQEARS